TAAKPNQPPPREVERKRNPSLSLSLHPLRLAYMAAAAPAASARAFSLSRVADLSPKPHQPRSAIVAPPPRLSRHGLVLQHHHQQLSSSAARNRTVRCLSNGGGNDSVSTRKLDWEFSVIANMLKRIEPLDNSVISQGVSDSAKDSMKQTISTMLGLLPSDHFSVSIKFSKQPLHRLLFSAIVTGYTLWNAEYRMSLTRNLDVSAERPLDSAAKDGELELLSEDEREESESVAVGGEEDDLEISPDVLGDLPPEALEFIQQLTAELADAEEELQARKQETIEMELNRRNKNDLLDYLRSLDPDMVLELSRPSCMEVEDIMHQLVQNILRRFFKDAPTANFVGDSTTANKANHQDDGLDEFFNTIGTSRDYLAKLLFWCMLLGHHLRGVENRLHLSCVVGLL
ncbi:hypothetical protein Tsubulata_013639, partial [Turnera subulata]